MLAAAMVPGNVMPLVGVAAILTEGGDDRTTINSKGVNKYHCRPQPIEGAIFRGSCTCNIPTEGGYRAAEAAYQSIQDGDVSVGDIMEGVRSKIKSMSQVPAGTEVFLCPSGSDAEYIPLQIAKILTKGRKIVNIVTCDSEVGSGTLDAAGGKYFSPVVPLPEDGMMAAAMGDPVKGLAENVETVSIAARDMGDSSVVCAKAGVQEAVDNCASEGSVPIVHCVLGSKTGIVEPFPATNFGQMVSARDAFIVVDACQGRFRSDQLTEYLNNGAFVLITGSKFYRGPPFSGAVLVPSQVMERLLMTDTTLAPGLSYFLSSNEVPEALSSWRSALKDTSNTGLALRWVAALDEMEPTLAIADDDKDLMTAAWLESVLSELEKYPDQLEAFEPRSCSTIVSLRLKAPGGAYYNNAECKNVFQWMTLDMSQKTGTQEGAPRCYIGQPVNVAKGGGCVLRIALGSDSLRQLAGDAGAARAEDAAIVAKLALLTKNYAELSAK
mmetsp:Transcript_30261/g.59091  ORF Transcript_30261/g.59091 Transcript_30261/m.59091 type:complete len:496 (+) Transcript_30261:65-1552(+)